jgi:hypothetical protein
MEPVVVSTAFWENRNVGCAGAAVLVLIVAFAFYFETCGGSATNEKPATTAASAPVVATPLASAGPRTPTCDLDVAGSVTESEVRAWSPECRKTALGLRCKYLCGEDMSDDVIAASATTEEKKDLIRLRLERNGLVVDRAKGLYKRARDIQRYALSIRWTPRGLDTACMQRMRADFARIDDLWAAAKSLPLPLGGGGLIEMLGSAKGCVSCDDDRSECDDMAAALKSVSESIGDFEKQMATDRKLLAAK